LWFKTGVAAVIAALIGVFKTAAEPD